ncbi:glycosyl hydrolase [Pelagicoccus mobilis]|uniref:Alpha-L-rhamnosidase-like protein n=1 Tax=Pelagicoccus mobilis TaxID=415221 RepID=A0A934RXN8_9BACT|nr:glycosyl hydrolase [Pelagicoccus mobilis]MBK1878672.1 hypothetical protein [Pelagicoccus mobilis]
MPFPTKLFLISLLAPLSLQAAEDPLFQLFEDPPSEYRPFVRWWWNGARIDEQEAIRQLDVLKDAGFGGVEINTIAMPHEADPSTFEHAPAMTWLGPDWCNTVEAVALAAKQRDLTPDIIIGSGWPFGGEFLETDHQIQRLRITKTPLQGPLATSIELTKLANANSGSEDHESIHDTTPSRSEYTFLRLVNEDAYENEASGQLGTELLHQTSDGSIDIKIPEGNFTLILGIVETGYTQVKLGAPGAKGRILDHFNGTAVSKYLDYMSTEMERNIGENWGDLFRATFVDSLELAHCNWTHDFPSQFEKRRGYSATPFLPFILDPERQDKTTRRARYDYSKTIIELFDERFATTYVEWCERNNLGSRIQAYGRETHPLHGSMRPTHPEGESWLWHDERDRPRIFADSSAINKYASSAAHLSGKRTVSFEAMTNAVPVFRETLGDFKRTFDLTAQSGPNHPIIHGFNYTPLEAGFPGWVRFGCYLNERNPFWQHMHQFNDYAARVGTILRNSDYQAQIAVLAPRPEEWERYGLLYQPFPEKVYPWYQYRLPIALQKLGFGVDFVSEEIIAESTIENGIINYNGRKYQALVLEEVAAISQSAAEKVAQFSNQSGKLVIIGDRPSRNSGLSPNWETNSAYIKEIFSTLRNHNTLDVPPPAPPEGYTSETASGKRGEPFDDSQLIRSLAHIFQKLDLQQPAKLNAPSPWISLVHHKSDDDRDFLFLSNSNNTESVEFELTPQMLAPHAELWSPHDGSRIPIALSPKGTLKYTLQPADSILLAFANTSKPQATPIPPPTRRTESTTLSGQWTLLFQPADGSPSFERQSKKLADISLSSDPALASFSGKITYQKEIELPEAISDALLDLGIVNGTSTLKLNGKTIACKWYGAHEYKLGDIPSGRHSIEIEVTTTLGNYLKSLKDNKTAQRWTHWYRPIESGILQPVELVYSPN